MDSNMHNFRKWIGASALVFGVFAMQGCFFDVEHGHDHVDGVSDYAGELNVHWTIERDDNPLDCDQEGASDIFIDITTRSAPTITFGYGALRCVSEQHRARSGSYAGTAVLLDVSDREITTPAPLGDFFIDEGAITDARCQLPVCCLLLVRPRRMKAAMAATASAIACGVERPDDLRGASE